MRNRKAITIFCKEFQKITRNLEDTKMTLDSLSGILRTTTKNPNIFNLISEVGDMRDLFRDLKENILEVEKSVRNINPAQIERDFDLVSARFSEMEENMMKREDLKKKEFKDNNRRVFELLQVLV